MIVHILYDNTFDCYVSEDGKLIPDLEAYVTKIIKTTNTEQIQLKIGVLND
jgi:hypothetical protein